MSDSSDLDNALVALLGADTALLALCPNGAYLDEAPAGSTRYVIVRVVDSVDEPMFSARAFENVLYEVEARMLSTANGNIKSAAARIDVLLEQQTLTVSGYGVSTLRRESRVRMTEVDDVNPKLRWFRRGGQYRVVASS